METKPAEATETFGPPIENIIGYFEGWAARFTADPNTHEHIWLDSIGYLRTRRDQIPQDLIERVYGLTSECGVCDARMISG